MPDTSLYKNLIVSGCSFTHNEHESHITWGNCLAAWSGMGITNLAVNGAGNAHIADSIILHLEKNKCNPQDTLILVMWSAPDRIDLITDRQSSDYFEVRHRYHYDKFNELSTGNNNKKSPHFKNMINDLRKYLSQKSSTLTSWLKILSLTNYLKVNNYTFYYTAYYDIFHPSRGDLETELNEMNLSMDMSTWLITDTQSYLGNFVKERNLVAPDGWHPSIRGQEEWTKTILIPALIDKNILKG